MYSFNAKISIKKKRFYYSAVCGAPLQWGKKLGKENKRLELFMLYVARGDSKYTDEKFAGLHAGGKISKEKLMLTCDQVVSPE